MRGKALQWGDTVPKGGGLGLALLAAVAVWMVGPGETNPLVNVHEQLGNLHVRQKH